jgi:hypothetical protein
MKMDLKVIKMVLEGLLNFAMSNVGIMVLLSAFYLIYLRLS